MFKAVHKNLNASTAIAIAALVFAMTGGAYALGGASGGGSHTNAAISTKKKSKTKSTGTRGPRGPQGPEGKAGPAGPIGPQGPAGAPGAKGETGPKGETGERGETGLQGGSGAAGKSVVAAGESPGANCEQGGTSFEVEGSKTKRYACNGSPWTAGGTLPSGKTETGEWSMIVPHNFFSGYPKFAIASFAIPISKPSTYTATVIGIEEGEGESKENTKVIPANCKGNYSHPGAQPGNLCVFVIGIGGTFTKAIEVGNVEEGGAIASAEPEETTNAKGEPERSEGQAFGSWAITAK